MERKFQLNWPVFVEEAVRRRRGMKLTQKQLAALAKVSTPTVSRFENNEKVVEQIGAFPDHRLLVAGKRRDHGLGCFLAELLRAFFDALVEELAGVGLIAAGACALGDDGREIFEIEARHESALR